MEIYKALRLIRRFHDISQKEMASRLNVSPSLVSEIEAGKKSLSLQLLYKSAEIFDMPASSILFLCENSNKQPVPKFVVSKKILAMLEFVSLKEK